MQVHLFYLIKSIWSYSILLSEENGTMLPPLITMLVYSETYVPKQEVCLWVTHSTMCFHLPFVPRSQQKCSIYLFEMQSFTDKSDCSNVYMLSSIFKSRFMQITALYFILNISSLDFRIWKMCWLLRELDKSLLSGSFVTSPAPHLL